ncbi:hypothetical protein CKW46_07435 [Mycobacterium liflandii]|nr:hypothetical protein CKW46_07435 [Mycobacterium liflandii]
MAVILRYNNSMSSVDLLPTTGPLAGIPLIDLGQVVRWPSQAPTFPLMKPDTPPQSQTCALVQTAPT